MGEYLVVGIGIRVGVVAAFPPKAGFARGISELESSGVIEDLPLLGVGVELDGRGTAHVEDTDLLEIDGLGVEPGPGAIGLEVQDFRDGNVGCHFKYSGSVG